MEKKLVEVVIPIYRVPLPKLEMALLRNNIAKLKNYPIRILATEGLDVSTIIEEFPDIHIGVYYISDEWLGSVNGIHGYNMMMLSKGFYELFESCKYILICQTDVYIFKDELTYWCNQGYDYIGAPWFRKAKYNTLLAKSLIIAKRILLEFAYWGGYGIMREDLLGRVGNGGLSLRRVSSCIEALDQCELRLNKYVNCDFKLVNEDIFWTMEPENFSYPTYEKAFHFAIDTKPELCMKMLEPGQYPFGCHGLTRAEFYDFWREIIDIEQ